MIGGDSRKKSIHHPDASLMPVDPTLLDDVRRLHAHFGIEQLAVDYMVERLGHDGAAVLLEVNHIPNVTLFPDLRTAYLDFVAAWLAGPG